MYIVIHTYLSVLHCINLQLRSNYTGYTGADFSVEMFPKLSFLVNNIVIQAIASMYYIMAYAPFVSFLVSNLVAEKERKIKDGMKMMGLRDAAFWYVQVV